MKCESEQYRYARIEGYRITLAHLEDRFRDAAVNLEQMEAAVVEQLAEETLCAPWRTSKTERAGCRVGMRLAALQFLSQYREAMGKSQLERPRLGAASTARL